MKDKRILIAGVFHFPSGTAPASRILNIAEGFLLNNFKVDVVAFCPPPGQSAKPDFWYSLKENIRFRYIAESQAANNSISEKISWYRNNWKAGKQIKNILEQEIKDSAYDAILIYGRNYSILGPVTKLANALDIPLITDLVELPRTSISKKYYLNPIHIDQHIGLKYTINRSQVVTVITRYLGDFIDNKNTYLMPSVQVWKDEAIEREYKIGNEIKIIYVGNLINRDNPKVMFDFIKAVNQHINVKLQLLGRFKNKADWKYWEEYVSKDEVLSESVQVIGEVTEKEKEEYYNNAEAFILPRRNHFDEVASFPTRIVEFLKERKLVIASPIGDIPHYLSENEIIYLEEDNMDQSVQLAIDTFSSVTSYQSYIERAYKVASQKFNTETHVSKILEIIR